MLLSRFKIVGHSMSPTYPENQSVLVSSLPLKFGMPRVGDVVVFEKFNKYYVKRVGKIKYKKFYLVGDNTSDSQDSRRFGLVKSSQIRGKVIAKI